jgi:hypothetical protein
VLTQYAYPEITLKYPDVVEIENPIVCAIILLTFIPNHIPKPGMKNLRRKSWASEKYLDLKRFFIILI